MAGNCRVWYIHGEIHLSKPIECMTLGVMCKCWTLVIMMYPCGFMDTWMLEDSWDGWAPVWRGWGGRVGEATAALGAHSPFLFSVQFHCERKTSLKKKKSLFKPKKVPVVFHGCSSSSPQFGWATWELNFSRYCHLNLHPVQVSSDIYFLISLHTFLFFKIVLFLLFKIYFKSSLFFGYTTHLAGS